MESSSVHRWSNKKRSKTVLHTNVFAAAIREVQVQVEAENTEPSVTSSAMNLHPLRQLSEAQGASSAAIPQSQQDNGGAPAPPEELLPSLNLSREDYQHWMDCYDKACKARDETSIVYCRHYWYVAVYLPSVAPPADVLSTPKPLFL